MKTLAILFWTCCAIAATAWANGDERAVNGVIGAGFVAIVLTILAVIEGRP